MGYRHGLNLYLFNKAVKQMLDQQSSENLLCALPHRRTTSLTQLLPKHAVDLHRFVSRTLKKSWRVRSFPRPLPTPTKKKEKISLVLGSILYLNQSNISFTLRLDSRLEVGGGMGLCWQPCSESGKTSIWALCCQHTMQESFLITEL